MLGKIKGYPAWPARVSFDNLGDHLASPPVSLRQLLTRSALLIQVCDPASANKKVAKEKPTKGKNHYLVQFFPTGDLYGSPRFLCRLDPQADSCVPFSDFPARGYPRETSRA